MRIRLLIERNELPSVSILWSFTPTQLSSTIAQFLENVSVRFPLEGNTWGLEDYTVSLGGYEAQHYTKVGDVFKEDDEVVIKPLLFAEARARTISGRYQITNDGRRLFDGVPFGKPLLKRMRRPEVNIPPARKRARIEEMDERAVVRFEALENSEDEDEDEDDGDFEGSEDDEPFPEVRVQLEGLEKNGLSWLAEKDSDDTDSSSGSSKSGTGDGAQALDASSDDSSGSSDSESSSDDSSSSGSDSDANGNNDEEMDGSDGSSSSPGSSDSWAGIETSDTITPAAADPPPPIPLKGAARTKERNNRRREAARLKHLKKSGELPSFTTLKQMQEWIQTGELPLAPDPDVEATQKSSGKTKEQDRSDLELERKRRQLISDINGGGIDVSSDSVTVTLAAIPDKIHPPQVKKFQKKSETSTPSPDDDGPEEIPIATAPVMIYPIIASTPTITTQDSPLAVPTEGPKRVSAAQRLIYGSLGLKAPKTQADKDSLQKKLADRSRKSAAEVPVVEQEVEEEDPEAWREKVIISAVECLDEGVELSEPPFPFQQKWDPQYWGKNNKKRTVSRGGEGVRNKKRKNNSGGEFVEVYDKYNQDGGGDALNYDDPVDEDEDDEEWDDGEDWQDGALLGADEVEEYDGFPDMPEDTTTLPTLLEADAQVGDFVVFTEMACSDATGWQPKFVTNIGCLDASDEGAWTVRFPPNVGEKEYDDEGNRIYKKFEMEGFDDDFNENLKEMTWAEMTDVKLLERPDVVEKQAGDKSSYQSEAGGVDEQIQNQLEGEMDKEASSTDQ